VVPRWWTAGRSRLSRRELARFIGVVPQREEIWIPLTVEETVQLGRYPRLGPLSPLSAADHAAVRQALERCDVWSFRDRPIEDLSGGEWQRVRLARALAQEPRALVLDEPGAALDIRHEMEALTLVRQLVNDGLGCLLITHHINLAARFADRWCYWIRQWSRRVLPARSCRRKGSAGSSAAGGGGVGGAPQLVPLRSKTVEGGRRQSKIGEDRRR
jgi:ABC-type cobalamin/Fe3+-siderophores transport system ATPase subunit